MLAVSTPSLSRVQLSILGALIGAASLLGCGGDSGPASSVGADRDRDGVANSSDNCPDHVNSRQFDYDEDGIGNMCDNCPYVVNPDQADTDLDGLGDPCETITVGGQELSDLDGDLVHDGADNCPFDPNTDQANGDADALGDVCDDDLDNDGISNILDPDIDGDGVVNADDAAPESALACRDADGDSCDDCSSGEDDVADDGLDSDGDGFCDAGLVLARVVVGVDADSEVFGLRLRVQHDETLASPIVSALGWYDPDSEKYGGGFAPDVSLTSNESDDDEVLVLLTFTTFVPDPSFLPNGAPEAVVQLDFPMRPDQPMGEFSVTTCELSGIDSVDSTNPECMILSAVSEAP